MPKIPFGPDCTPADEVAFLRERMALLNQQVSDPAKRDELTAEIRKVIEEIETGLRRLSQDK
jgi:hypothetical protein